MDLFSKFIKPLLFSPDGGNISKPLVLVSLRLINFAKYSKVNYVTE